MADNARSRAQEEAGQNDSFDPSLRRQSSELVSLTYAAMGGQQAHGSVLRAKRLQRLPRSMHGAMPLDISIVTQTNWRRLSNIAL